MEQPIRKYDRHRSKTHRGSSSPTKSPRGREKLVGPPTFILDNGAYAAKLGLSTAETSTYIPNCIMKVKSERKRFFIGNQIEECRDLSGLYYLLPCEKGYITKWNVQKPVWDYIFNNVCNIEDTPVILTQPLFNFKPIQEITDEIFFEEYEIKSMYRTTPMDLARYEYVTNVKGKEVACIIVDSGFSFTHVVPYINGKKYYKACRRINVGGKLLTNYLKDIISYRQLHVMDETYIINQVKEDACYASLDFKQDMKIAEQQGDKNTIVKNYVLPDFNNIRRGYVQQPGDTEVADGCQILRLNNERFTVPEILFYPSDIGMDSMGIAETIVKCIRMCPPNQQPILAKNIVLMGGNCNIPGFKERVYADVRSYLPDHWTVDVFKPKDPVGFAWLGGKSFSEDPAIKSVLVTKEQYEESGSSYTYQRFSDWTGTRKESSENAERKTEITPVPNSILLEGNFSRLDLFGKHETVTADDGVLNDQDVNLTENSDRAMEKESVDSEKVGESSKSASESKSVAKNDGDNLEAAAFNGSEAVDDGSKLQKSTAKSTSGGRDLSENDRNRDMPARMDLFDTYDFHILENSYI